MRGILLLEEGTAFEGVSIGATGEWIGEVVLNTAVVGYQEMMTDTANAGKILVLTYPLIGNYGMATRFSESARPWIGSLIIREKSRIYSNWQAEFALSQFLDEHHLLALSEVDTRTLAVKIRDRGEMPGIVSTADTTKTELARKLKEGKERVPKDFISRISVSRVVEVAGSGSGLTLAVLDLGIHNGFLRQLKQLAGRILLLPYHTSPEAILELKPDGLIVSNGPEEDEALPRIVETVRHLLGKIPLLGISTGHEVICLALGGRRKRMKLGHRGANYPVLPPSSLRGQITFQNHSWVVEEESLQEIEGVTITLRNLNDDTVEEVEADSLRLLGVQYYPISPGLGEINPVFLRFRRMIKGR